MFPLKVGDTYVCTKTIKIDGVVWFVAGKRYVFRNLRSSHQGEIELSFCMEGTQEIFSFQAMVTDADYKRVIAAFVGDDSPA